MKQVGIMTKTILKMQCWLIKFMTPARFTVNWIGPEGKKHPNTYCVNIRKDRGESWDWVTRLCLKASDAAEMINLEVGIWEHNNYYNESTKLDYAKILNG